MNRFLKSSSSSLSSYFDDVSSGFFRFFQNANLSGQLFLCSSRRFSGKQALKLMTVFSLLVIFVLEFVDIIGEIKSGED